MQTTIHSTDRKLNSSNQYDIGGRCRISSGGNLETYTVYINPNEHTYSMNDNKVTMRIHYDITGDYTNGSYVIANIAVNGTNIVSNKRLNFGETINNYVDHVMNCNKLGGVNNFTVSVTLEGYNSDGTPFYEGDNRLDFFEYDTGAKSTNPSGTFYFNKVANSRVKINGVWKTAFAWFKTVVGWRRCVMWKKINGVWKRGK